MRCTAALYCHLDYFEKFKKQTNLNYSIILKLSFISETSFQGRFSVLGTNILFIIVQGVSWTLLALVQSNFSSRRRKMVLL